MNDTTGRVVSNNVNKFLFAAKLVKWMHTETAPDKAQPLLQVPAN